AGCGSLWLEKVGGAERGEGQVHGAQQMRDLSHMRPRFPTIARDTCCPALVTPVALCRPCRQLDCSRTATCAPFARRAHTATQPDRVTLRPKNTGHWGSRPGRPDARAADMPPMWSCPTSAPPK